MHNKSSQQGFLLLIQYSSRRSLIASKELLGLKFIHGQANLLPEIVNKQRF
jgi:hypothetical protein